MKEIVRVIKEWLAGLGSQRPVPVLVPVPVRSRRRR